MKTIPKVLILLSYWLLSLLILKSLHFTEIVTQLILVLNGVFFTIVSIIVICIDTEEIHDKFGLED